MGNAHQKTHSAVVPHQDSLEKLYQSLCYYGILCEKIFKKHFYGPSITITNNLFDRFFIDLMNSCAETTNLFVERSHHILETSYQSQIDQNQFYSDLITENKHELDEHDVRKLVLECSQYGILTASLSPSDDKLSCEEKDYVIDGIANSVLNGATTIPKTEFISWLTHNFPSIFSGLQAWLYFKFTSHQPKCQFEMLCQPSECESWNLLLTPTLLWYLCCILPSCFVRMDNKFETHTDEQSVSHDEHTKYTWNLLYHSNQHGLSLNRFKHKVMDYKSPTLTLIEFSSGLIIALGLDQYWVDSAERFGGPYCHLIEVFPVAQVIEANSKMIYLKESGRSIPTGLIIGSETRPKLKISTDLSSAEVYYKNLTDEYVEQVEVWGCGGVEAIKSQNDIKKWERNEVEKRKKVKLPGQWDVDKQILEMGGVCVNHNQRDHAV